MATRLGGTEKLGFNSIPYLEIIDYIDSTTNTNYYQTNPYYPPANFGMARGLMVINDSASANLTLTIPLRSKTLTMIIKPNEVFDDRFDDFTTFTITQTGASWRCFVKQ